MAKNKRKQTKRLPYKLEVDGVEYGAYQNMPINLIRWLRENSKAYRLFHMDEMIDEN